MGPGSDFSVATDIRNGVAKLALSGELDFASRPTLDAELDRFVDDGVGTIVLDLRDLTFTDTAGIHTFQACERAAAHNRRLLVIGAAPGVRRIFELTEKLTLLDDEAAGTLDHFMNGQMADEGDGAA